MKYLVAALVCLVFTGCSTELTSEEQFFNDYCENQEMNIDCSRFTDEMANAEGRFIPERCSFRDTTLQCLNFGLQDNQLLLEVQMNNGNSLSEVFTSVYVEDGFNRYSCTVDEIIECDVDGSIYHLKEGYIITLTQPDGRQSFGSVLVST